MGYVHLQGRLDPEQHIAMAAAPELDIPEFN